MFSKKKKLYRNTLNEDLKENYVFTFKKNKASMTQLKN